MWSDRNLLVAMVISFTCFFVWAYILYAASRILDMFFYSMETEKFLMPIGLFIYFSLYPFPNLFRGPRRYGCLFRKKESNTVMLDQSQMKVKDESIDENN